MKQATCSQIGGPATCTATFQSDTPEGLIDQAWKHLQEAHTDMANNIKNNPPEENEKWMANFKTVTFPSLPDVA